MRLLTSGGYGPFRLYFFVFVCSLVTWPHRIVISARWRLGSILWIKPFTGIKPFARFFFHFYKPLISHNEDVAAISCFLFSPRHDIWWWQVETSDDDMKGKFGTLHSPTPIVTIFLFNWVQLHLFDTCNYSSCFKYVSSLLMLHCATSIASLLRPLPFRPFMYRHLKKLPALLHKLTYGWLI